MPHSFLKTFGLHWDYLDKIKSALLLLAVALVESVHEVLCAPQQCSVPLDTRWSKKRHEKVTVCSTSTHT